MDRPKIEQIRERCNRATEGPWAWNSPYEKSNGYVVGVAVTIDGDSLEGKIDDPDDMVDDIVEYHAEIGEHEASTCNYNDPAFISHARTDVPKLLNWIEELESQLKAAREVSGKITDNILNHFASKAGMIDCQCSWDYVTGQSPNYFCGKCGAPMKS